MNKSLITLFLQPDKMSAHQRAAEITLILANALMRIYSSGHNATDQKNKDELSLAFCQESAFIPTPLNMQNRSLK